MIRGGHDDSYSSTTIGVCHHHVNPRGRSASARKVATATNRSLKMPTDMRSDGLCVLARYDGRAPTVSLLGAALGGGGGDFRSTNMYMPNVHAIAAVHPARMSDG